MTTAIESPVRLSPEADSPPRENRRISLHSYRHAVIVALAWLLGASVFFRAQWTSGFDRVMGNDGDPRLIVYLNEQWFLALRGAQPWRSPPFFYPTNGLLGYTDTFFLFQIFFAPFRVLGAEPFLAFQLTLIALSLLGFVSFVIFTRMAFRAPILIAVIGALVFTFANNLSNHEGSPQLFGIYFVPFIALMGLLSWRTRQTKRGASLILGILVGLTSALLLFSTYYVAWFSLFVTAVVLVLMFLFAPRVMTAEVRMALRTGWRSALGIVGGFAVGIVPFLVTYVPVIRAQGARSYSDTLMYAARLDDVTNIGTGNLLWRELFQRWWSLPSSGSYEVSYAVTPVLLLTVAVGGAVVVWRVLRHRTPFTPMLRLTLALCCSSVLLAVLPIETWKGSAWVLIWHLPGANAIRATDRIQIASDLVTALALVALATEAIRHWPRLRRSMPLLGVGLALLCFIVAEQVNNTVGSQLQRGAEIAFLASVPAPPAGCASFYVTDTVQTDLPYYQYQTDAMLISQRFGLPTLNGYSGDEPPGWGGLNFPETSSYTTFVRQWADTHGLLTGVCDLDLGHMSWNSHPQL
jgi:hypothetical protein